MSRRSTQWKDIIRKAGSRDKALVAVPLKNPGKMERFVALINKIFPAGR